MHIVYAYDIWYHTVCIGHMSTPPNVPKSAALTEVFAHPPLAAQVMQGVQIKHLFRPSREFSDYVPDGSAAPPDQCLTHTMVVAGPGGADFPLVPVLG